MRLGVCGRPDGGEPVDERVDEGVFEEDGVGACLAHRLV